MPEIDFRSYLPFFSDPIERRVSQILVLFAKKTEVIDSAAFALLLSFRCLACHLVSVGAGGGVLGNTLKKGPAFASVFVSFLIKSSSPNANVFKIKTPENR